MKKKDKIKKRKVVEIYFVLYLAALVFLLPSKQENSDDIINSDALVDYGFNLIPEKTSLLCIYKKDQNGNYTVSYDSTNIIYHTGEFSDVDFEFIIEDQHNFQQILLDENNQFSNKFFKIIEKPELKAAEFIWTPPQQKISNRALIIHVTAKGKTNTNNEIIAKTKFSINMYNEDNQNNNEPDANINFVLKQDTSQNQNQISRDQLLSTLIPGNIDLRVMNSPVFALGYDQWKNEISIQGISKISTAMKKPKVSIENFPSDNGGSVKIEKIDDYTIYFAGKAPYTGHSKVTFTIQSAFNDKSYSSDFIIKPKKINIADIPNTIYPEAELVIDPKLPEITNKSSSAVLLDGNSIIKTCLAGEKIQYKASYSDIGKTLTLQRKIDNRILDQHRIEVKDYKKPEIVRINLTSEGKALVEIRSYGILKGKPNYIQSLDIVEGDVKYYIKPGTNSDNYKDYSYSQSYEIINKNSNKAFKFKIRAKDRRGRYSETKEFSSQ